MSFPSVRATPLALLLPLLCGTLSLRAQADRYELGLRLRAFERRLEATEDAARRNAALDHMKRAVQAFFRFDTGSVAAAIADADRTLRAADEDVATRVATSLALALEARLVPAGVGSVGFTLTAAYRADDEAELGAVPEGLTLVVEPVVAGAEGARLALTEVPAKGSLSLRGVPEGDHPLRWSIRRGDTVLVAREQAISVAERLDARLSTYAAHSPYGGDDRKLETATLPFLLQTLEGMRKPRQEETVLAGVRMLEQAEALMGTTPYYGPKRPGDFLLRVPVGGKTLPVRLSVPKQPSGERVPLVLALHGAGGSENLFFDGYGDGKVVRLAESRGWYVVAPRNELGGVDGAGLIDALATRFPIDVERVLLVGHSMGAMQAMANASRTPARFAAVAALGGGGGVRRSPELAKTPFFVGVGEFDFALAQARSLNRSLLAAGAECTLREYPGVEHLAIVQIALDDVMTWFASQLTSQK
jgi:predicted esterase